MGNTEDGRTHHADCAHLDCAMARVTDLRARLAEAERKLDRRADLIRQGLELLAEAERERDAAAVRAAAAEAKWCALDAKWGGEQRRLRDTDERAGRWARELKAEIAAHDATRAKLAAVMGALEWTPGDEDQDPEPDVWERADLERFVLRVWGALADTDPTTYLDRVRAEAWDEGAFEHGPEGGGQPNPYRALGTTNNGGGE